MTFLEYPDRDFLMLSLADRIAGQLGEVLRRGEAASLCVPGGTTPGPVFDTLSGVALDWDRVSILLTDERWVGEDDPRSNTALVRRRLLQGQAAAARLVPMRADTPAPEDALGALAEGVAPHLPLSVLLIGMGEDMHVASLFPGAEGLAAALAADAPPVVAIRAPDVPEPRVTLSAPVLAGAIHVHLLILGAAKRAALERAQGLALEDAPVRAILDAATVHWAE